MTGSPNWIEKLHLRLSAEEALLLREIVAAAEQTCVNVYAVGGTARDLLLDVESLDLDVAVEGDALDLARSIAERTGARVVKLTRFGTASLKLGQATVDVATTRREKYLRPGALPVTDGGAIQDDLLRRDFTINALALRLTGSAAGELLDPADGGRDMRDGCIRVLHDGSLVDDPTRMIRAARYEQRLGFVIHPDTESLIRRDLGTLDTVSGTRIRQEVERTLREDGSTDMLSRMDALGVLSAIHPGLAFRASQAKALRRLRGSGHDSMLARWAIVAWGTRDEAIESLCARLAPSGRLRDVLHSLPLARAAEHGIARETRASAVASLLRGLPAPTVAALSCATQDSLVRERVLDYLDRTRSIHAVLSGDDVIAMGVSEGPEVGLLLSRLRDAKIDGAVTTREDELAVVRTELSERKAPVGN